MFTISDSNGDRVLNSVEKKFEALEEDVKQAFMDDARNLSQRWYALTGGVELNLVSDIK
jgi:hypothetical protein